MKDFKLWFLKKEVLHFNNYKSPYFNESEIWWCSIGENVGDEINGKSEYFRRPVLIIKKLSKHSFIGLPLTTKQKLGSWYVNIEHNNKKSVVVLSQVRNFDYRRLDKKLADLGEVYFTEVMKSLDKLLFCKK